MLHGAIHSAEADDDESRQVVRPSRTDTDLATRAGIRRIPGCRTSALQSVRVQKRVVLVATLIVLAAVGVTAAVVARSTSLAEDGPMRPTLHHAWATPKPVPVGNIFADGFEFLTLRHGSPPAVIDSVSIEGADGLVLVGAKVVGPDRPHGGTDVAPWPVSSAHGFFKGATIRDARGATIPNGDPWELVLAIKPTRNGYLVRKGVRVNYTVVGKHYTLFKPAELAVCTSTRYYKRGECPMPDLSK